MTTVHIQIASEFQPPVLAYLRRQWFIGLEISDSDIWDQLLGDIGRTLTEYCSCWQRRGQQKPIPDSWVFLHSHWESSRGQLSKLAYEVLLQDFSLTLPIEENDIPLDVTSTPQWLNRVIVVVWEMVTNRTQDRLPDNDAR